MVPVFGQIKSRPGMPVHTSMSSFSTMETMILLGKNPQQLGELTSSLNLPKFAARQLSDWLYKKHAASFEAMTNLSKAARSALAGQATIGCSDPGSVAVSTDGTKKYLFRALAGAWIETAWIPDDERATLCLSTQAGCRMGCHFCATARQGFSGNLDAADILNQYRSLPERDTVSNIVYMGMGEPLDNLEAVLASIRAFTEDWGLAMSPRRITVSTCGILAPLRRLLDETEVHVALSLHNPFDEERAQLMPIARSQPLEPILDLLRSYNWRGQRRLTLEYILFDGYNDSEDHFRQLVRLTRGLGDVRINLLRWNSVPGDDGVRGAPEETLELFRDSLNDEGIIATIRRSRGGDIAAACGLLSTARLRNAADTAAPAADKE